MTDVIFTNLERVLNISTSMNIGTQGDLTEIDTESCEIVDGMRLFCTLKIIRYKFVC